MPTLDDLLDQLAAVPPRAFAKERNALAARLTKLGQAAGAAKVKARRAPTIPIWAINRLAREHPKLVEELVTAAERVGAAQLGGDAQKQLGAAMDAYRGATEALLGHLDNPLTAAGVKAPHQVRLRIQKTLMAAAADPKLRKALRSGRLEQELTASGFDVFGGRVPVKRAESARSAPAPARRGPSAEGEPRRSAQDRKAAAREARARDKAEARRSAQERKAAAREAQARDKAEAKEAADRERAAATERLRSLREAAEEAGKVLEEARAQARRADEDMRAAAGRKREADRALNAAQRRR